MLKWTFCYFQLLENEGYIPISVPVLKFNFINTEEYNTRLTNYTDYHCIVFTSQQAVKVTQQVIQSWTGWLYMIFFFL
jgi:uroporphyrinogen-III synthase